MKKIFTLFLTFIFLSAFSQSIGLTTFASGFSEPVDIAHPGGDTRLFIVEKGGSIRILNLNGTINATPFLNVAGLLTNPLQNEQGLLGLTFHPNYATNGFFYINYTNSGGNTVIARYSVSANPNVANTSGSIILTVNQPYINHNGGSLKFGTDGFLYIGMGDGGSSGDPGNRAQNINENLGKMLRIDVDSASPYAIPPTNPYVGIVGNDEIWAVGLRNPWKFTFDMLNGDLWIADVGQNQVEEINYIAAPAAPGLNFGWKCYEGNSVYSTCTTPTTYKFPIATYTHSGGACSITGGYVYRGSLYPNFTGKYFFADYCSNKIGMVNTAGNVVWSTAFAGTNITTFGQDINGEIYVGGGSSGIIYKLKDTTLGVAAFDNGSFQIFPNPASSEFHIKSSGMAYPASVSIYDVTGKLLLNQVLNEESQAIATTSLHTGLYMVTVKDNSGMNLTSKLSVK